MIKKFLYSIKSFIKVTYVKLKYKSYIQNMCSLYISFMRSYKINGNIETLIQNLTLEELDVLYQACQSRDKLILIRYYEIYLGNQKQRCNEIKNLSIYFENEVERLVQDPNNEAVDVVLKELETFDCSDIIKKANHTLVQLAVHDVDRKVREFIDNTNS